MAAARHRQAEERVLGRRLLRLALPATAAALVTASAVGVSIARSDQADRASTRIVAADAAAQASVAPRKVVLDPEDSPFLRARDHEFSRSAKRVTLEKKPAVKDHQFRTANLNLWPAPAEKGKPLTILEEGGKVAVTGVRKAGFAQILYDGQIRWVTAKYLADKMPVAPKAPTTSGSTSSDSTVSAAAGGVTTAPCPDGSSTESGLTPSAVRLYRSACQAFPALSSYGGWDGHGEHSSGKAIDFMLSDPALGQALADWARAHASELDLYDVIWAQHIWTPVRSGEGWRSMSDRGSATANHYDHVHIAVN